MSYTYTDGVDPTKPVGSTTQAKDIDTVIQGVKNAYNERLGGVFGGTWATDDPILPTKVGPSIAIQSDQANSKYYDAGNTGAAKTIDWNNGPTQKCTLTGNCTFTFSNPVQGATYSLEIAQDAIGSRTLTLPSTVRWTNNSSIPTLSTTASTVTLVSFYWTGTRYLASLAGSGFNVS
jgi:hypothetical protein